MRASVPLMHVEKRMWMSATERSLEAVRGYGFGAQLFFMFLKGAFSIAL